MSPPLYKRHQRFPWPLDVMNTQPTEEQSLPDFITPPLPPPTLHPTPTILPPTIPPPTPTPTILPPTLTPLPNAPPPPSSISNVLPTLSKPSEAKVMIIKTMAKSNGKTELKYKCCIVKCRGIVRADKYRPDRDNYCVEHFFEIQPRTCVGCQTWKRWSDDSPYCHPRCRAIAGSKKKTIF